jgi:hypothetical protein
MEQFRIEFETYSNTLLTNVLFDNLNKINNSSSCQEQIKIKSTTTFPSLYMFLIYNVIFYMHMLFMIILCLFHILHIYQKIQ